MRSLVDCTNSDLAIIFEPDMAKGTPGWLITWFMDNDLISIESAWEWYPEFMSWIDFN